MSLRTLIFAMLLSLAPAGVEAALRAGDRAPDFSIPASQGGKDFPFHLAEALKKGPVVLYFYPKSFTSVCTVEAHEFAEAMEDFAAAGASVIGVSSDGIETQREFSKKECRDKFPVGADPDFKVIEAYDAAFKVPLKGAVFAERLSYVIAPDGKILSAYADANAHGHIVNALAQVRKWRDEHPR